MADDRTNEVVELLQALIRNGCVNDGTITSGQEVRNVDVLQTYLEGTGLDLERYESNPGRVSLVARIEGSDADAPSLCLMGHTDVVPVNEDGWSRDPFAGEIVDGEVWGRGAVDMLNLTSAQAVAFRCLADEGFRPRGDLIYFAVADEESGSSHGARWMADKHPEVIRADYVLTESGGIHSGSSEAPSVGVTIGEKGVAWRRLIVHGTPGHGSMPYRTDNALVTAAEVVKRLADYAPAPRVHELWRAQVMAMDLPDELSSQLLDEGSIDATLAGIDSDGVASHLHACTHTTFSVNVASSGGKTNVIPDKVVLDVDVRTLPGEDASDVSRHLSVALGDLAAGVEVKSLMNDRSSSSRTDNPLWDALDRAVGRVFPTAHLSPSFAVGFTDARIFREMGSVAYGAGLFSPDVELGEFARRFHGNDERIDLESLRLTTGLYLDVVRDLLGG